MTGNDRLEKLTPFLELVRILNLAIKRMIEVNSCKNRSKLFQPSDINDVLRWSELAKLVETFRRQVCLFDLVLSLSNKIKYCILLYRTPSLSFILVCYETMTSKNVDAQRSYLQQLPGEPLSVCEVDESGREELKRDSISLPLLSCECLLKKTQTEKKLSDDGFQYRPLYITVYHCSLGIFIAK